MEQLKANYQEMLSISKNVMSLADEYASNLTSIYEIIDSLESDWKGVDNLAYITKVNGYKKDIMALPSIINNYAKFLETSANLISQTQSDIASQAGRGN